MMEMSGLWNAMVCQTMANTLSTSLWGKLAMDPLLKVAVCGNSIAGYFADWARVLEMPPPLLRRSRYSDPTVKMQQAVFLVRCEAWYKECQKLLASSSAREVKTSFPWLLLPLCEYTPCNGDLRRWLHATWHGSSFPLYPSSSCVYGHL